MSNTSGRGGVRRAVLLAAGIVLLAAGFSTAARAWHLLRHFRSAEIGLAQLNTMLGGGMEGIGRTLQTPEQVTLLRATTAGLLDDLIEMQNLARPFLPFSRILGWVPRVGGDLKSAPYLLEMARDTASMALALLDGLTPVTNLIGQKNTSLRSLAPKASEQILLAGPQVEAARAAFEEASRARSRIPADALSSRAREMVAKFDGYAPSVNLAIEVLELLPELLAAQQPKTYLILAQNSDELRATGGFISGVGRLRVSQGDITDISFQDSYAVDNLEVPHAAAPGPLRQYMKAGMLVLRDANWWPDFPTSARMVAELYAQDTGQAVDGVVAVDVGALELLMGALGPIEVPGYADRISAENLHDILMEYWQAPIALAPGDTSDWWAHRKDLAGDLLVALLQKAMGVSTLTESAALARSLGTALDQRHIQVYVNAPTAEAQLQRLGWDGAVRVSGGDFLMVVDSNVGFNKVNPNIEQTMSYDAVLSGSEPSRSELTLTYRHSIERPTPACILEPRYGDSYADLMERCYWDYLRIYLPAGSEVVELTGSDSPPDIYEESGCTVVGTGFLLETGQSRTIRLTYTHTIEPEMGRYALLVQKQAGARANPLRVRIQMPVGAVSESIVPAPVAIADGYTIWQAVLDQDLEFDVMWK